MATIGQLLKAAREKNKISLEDVHKDTKIHLKFLEALESDTYGIFSDKVHAKGFLKIYATYLGLNTNDIIALWRREYESNFDKHRDSKTYQLKKVSPLTFYITPNIMIMTLFLVITIIFFGYLFYKYKTYVGLPTLEVYQPINNKTITSDIIDITGKTDLDVTIYINNQKILLNPDGSFGTSIRLKEGINTLSIKAINKLDKEQEIIRTVIYRPTVIPIIRESSETSGSNHL